MPPKRLGRPRAGKGDVRLSPDFVTELGPHDVLMGRGAMATDYEGNQRLRALVASRYDEYSSATRRGEKHRIANDIVQTIMNKGGRFLEGADQVEDSRKYDIPRDRVVWLIVPESSRKQLINKVKQLVRDVGIRRAEKGQAYVSPPLFSQSSTTEVISSNATEAAIPLVPVPSVQQQQQEADDTTSAIQGLNSLFHHSQFASVPPMNQNTAQNGGGNEAANHQDGHSTHQEASPMTATYTIPNTISFPTATASSQGSTPAALHAAPPGVEAILQALGHFRQQPLHESSGQTTASVYSHAATSTTQVQTSLAQQANFPDNITSEFARQLMSQLQDSEQRRRRELMSLLSPLMGRQDSSNDLSGLFMNYLRRGEDGSTPPSATSANSRQNAQNGLRNSFASTHLSPLEEMAIALLRRGEEARAPAVETPSQLETLVSSLLGSSARSLAPSAAVSSNRTMEVDDIIARLTQRPPETSTSWTTTTTTTQNQGSPTQHLPVPPPPQDRPPPPSTENQRLLQILQLLQGGQPDQSRG